MIYGMLLSLCIAVAVFSRKLYYDSARMLSENIFALAIFLDAISSGGALLVLGAYFGLIP